MLVINQEFSNVIREKKKYILHGESIQDFNDLILKSDEHTNFLKILIVLILFGSKNEYFYSL